jgi:hypothetical protein
MEPKGIIAARNAAQTIDERTSAYLVVEMADHDGHINITSGGNYRDLAFMVASLQSMLSECLAHRDPRVDGPRRPF